MITSLKNTSMSFKANAPSTARIAYDNMLAQNKAVADSQNNPPQVQNTTPNSAAQIPVHGSTGKKLDVIA